LTRSLRHRPVWRAGESGRILILSRRSLLVAIIKIFCFQEKGWRYPFLFFSFVFSSFFCLLICYDPSRAAIYIERTEGRTEQLNHRLLTLSPLTFACPRKLTPSPFSSGWPPIFLLFSICSGCSGALSLHHALSSPASGMALCL